MSSSPFSPEEQVELYRAVRDNNIETIKSLFSAEININCRPFEALWHEPGPEATVLHLAACCIQPDVVEYLLARGADRNIEVAGLKPVDVAIKYELFEPARIQRPQDVERVIQLLREE